MGQGVNPLGSIEPAHSSTGTEFHDRLRAFLSAFRKPGSDKSFQGFDFVIGGTTDPTRHWLLDGTFYRAENYIAPAAIADVSLFNRAFYDLFEPIFAPNARHHRAAGPGQPLWYVVLEIDREQLHYSCFAYQERLKETVEFFKAHRAYEYIRETAEEPALLGLSDIVVASGDYRPVMVAINDGSLQRRLAAYRSAIGASLGIVALKAEGVYRVDKELQGVLTRTSPTERDFRAVVNNVASQFRITELLCAESGIATDARISRELLQHHEVEFVRYLVWLRSLALSANSDSVEHKNFAVYVYVPWPGLTWQSCRTITGAFTNWPDLQLLQWMTFDAPKAFQRYEALLPTRFLRSAQDVSQHEFAFLVHLPEYLRRRTDQLSLISWSVRAAALYFGRNPTGLAGTFLPPRAHRRRMLSEWCERLVGLAWKVYLARMALSSPAPIPRKIVEASERPSVVVNPAQLRLRDDFDMRGEDWRVFDWDITRWLMAALGNAIKHVIGQHLEKAQDSLPRVELTISQHEDLTTFLVRNPRSPDTGPPQPVRAVHISEAFGTQGVLRTIAWMIAGHEDSTFGPNPNTGQWEASLTIRGCCDL